MIKKFSYLNRVITAYLFAKNSQLSFWHGQPKITADRGPISGPLGPYYMPFDQKARYKGPFDAQGIPLLNYHGTIGKQYNPIAISQYGLSHHHLFCQTQKNVHLEKVKACADWLVKHLKDNEKGVPVWFHHFDFEYFQTLKNPWYSGLAQGQGISLLLRAHQSLKDPCFLACAKKAWISLKTEMKDGGVIWKDMTGNLWIEEYMTNPPTHILNGFIWAFWGVRDLVSVTQDEEVISFYDAFLKTLEENLHRFDAGFWSLYDLSPLKMKNRASSFYHALHLVQLEIMAKLTGKQVFQDYCDRWKKMNESFFHKKRAFFCKALFKLRYF